MSDTFFTRSGSSPGTGLEALADLVLRDNNAHLVQILRNTYPMMVLFRSSSNPDALHILPACDLHRQAIQAKLRETVETRHVIDTETLRCECGASMCFSCGGCSAEGGCSVDCGCGGRCDR